MVHAQPYLMEQILCGRQAKDKKMETIIVDRVEDGKAVCERGLGRFESIPLGDLPSGVKEGSVLSRSSSTQKWVIDNKQEQSRHSTILDKMNSLFK